MDITETAITTSDTSDPCEDVSGMEFAAEIGSEFGMEVSDGSLTIDGGEISAEAAESIAAWLIAKYRSQIILNYIDEIFGELTEAEREAVYESVCGILSGSCGIEHLEYIKTKITDFFETEKTMNIGGFINFRLRAYRDELRSIVEECACGIVEPVDRDLRDMIDVINFLFDVIT